MVEHHLFPMMMREFVANCSANNSGITYTRASLKYVIVSKEKVKFDALGLTSLGVNNTICTTTMTNAMVLMACHTEMHIIMSSVQQPRARIMASNLIRARVCLLFVAAMTCVVVLN
jgi:hypothetical protein